MKQGRITNTILDKILADKAEAVEQLKQVRPVLELERSLAERVVKRRNFLAAINQPGKFNLIAEIKKAVPGAGVIRRGFNLEKIASAYQNSGLVAAISVITEKSYFQGELDFTGQVRALTRVPILRKDFIFDEYQIYESKVAGADAVLLIVAIVQMNQLKRLIDLAHNLGMDCLVETHTKEEIEMALEAGAKIVGVNARDLRTFEVDSELFRRLVKYIPDEVVKVAESGLDSSEAVKQVYESGAEAVLIGTVLMKAKDIKTKIKELMSE